MGGIPPRPSVPPERSGGGQFRSKWVRAKFRIEDTLVKGKPEEAASLRPALPAGRSAANVLNFGGKNELAVSLGGRKKF